MGRGILLWLLGVPIPTIIILALIWHCPDRNTIMPDSSMVSMAGVYAEDRHRLEASTSGVVWPAIIGRAFAAVPLSQILLALGSGFSLASISPWSNAGPSVTTFTVMTAGLAESGADLVVISLRQAAEQVTMAKESWLRAEMPGQLAAVRTR